MLNVVRLRIYSVIVKANQHVFLALLPRTNNPGDVVKKYQNQGMGTGRQ
jgi:hypothetical protein